MFILESNPASILDPAWIKNYKKIHIKEKIYRNNRKEIYSKEMIGVDFLLGPVHVGLLEKYLPIQGYYLHCLECGALVPMNPEVTLKCFCGLILIDPQKKKVIADFQRIGVVKLIPKADSR